ncbi:MAG: hypothetical protein P4L87_21410, partial [Formivibrio sp.]|nr:hypothetical protein [Formivibrio sp.]
GSAVAVHGTSWCQLGLWSLGYSHTAMKSKVYSVLAKVLFAFTVLQISLLLLGVLFALLGPATTSSSGTVTIIEPGHATMEFIWLITPYLVVVISAGLGFYLRWLSRKLQLK